MKEEWKEYKLGDISTMKYGKLPPSSEGSKYPIWSGYRYVGMTDTFNCTKGTLVVVARGVGGTGDVKVAKEDCYLTNLSISVDVDTRICNPYFLYYKYLIKNLRYLDSGSAQSQIIIDALKNLRIKLPSLAYQNKLVAILKSLDDKIEVNKRINDNLEQQAQALFKSWFVDFAPFHDKPFVESELGMIPEGWRVGTIGDVICEVESGSRPKGGAEIDGIPSIGAEKIEKIGYYDYSGEKYINSEYFARMKRGHVKDGDVLLYKDGAYTGKSSMVLDGFPYIECAVNEHVFLLRTEASKYQFYLYCLVSYPEIKTTLHTLASSKAAQPGLNQKELLGVKIILPDETTIQHFNQTIAANMHKIVTNAKQNHNLSQIRDTLLPRLMSGELNVKDIEKTL